MSSDQQELVGDMRSLSESFGGVPSSPPPAQYDETQTHLMHMTFWPAMGATIICFWVAVIIQRWRIAQDRKSATK